MVCRLCFTILQNKKVAWIFKEGTSSETELSRMIGLHLQLKLTSADDISTKICYNCFKSLKRFHNFWEFVDQKQSLLRGRFNEVQCNDGDELENEDNLPVESITAELDYTMPLCNGQENCIDFEQNNEILHEMQDCYDDSGHSLDLSAHSDAVDSDANDSEAAESFRKSQSEKNPDEPQDTATVLDYQLDSKTNSECEDFEMFGKTRQRSNGFMGDRAHLAVEKKRKPYKRYTRTQRRPPVNSEENAENYGIIENFLDLQCDLCSFKPESYAALKNHFQTEHNRNSYVVCCDTYYTSFRVLLLHVLWHIDEEKYRCKLCNRLSRSENKMRMHVLWHEKHPQVKIKFCTVCQDEFLNVDEVPQDHMNKHDEENRNKPHRCEICGKNFKKPTYVFSHIRTIHERKIPVPTPPIFCELCGKQFKSKEYYADHLIEHQGLPLPRVQCDICLVWVRDRSCLSAHKRKHIESDHLCNTCGERFNDILSYHSHLVKHTPMRRKRFACERCDKMLPSRSHMMEHLAGHDNIKLYKCLYCYRKTRFVANLRKHLERCHESEWSHYKKEKFNGYHFLIDKDRYKEWMCKLRKH